MCSYEQKNFFEAIRKLVANSFESLYIRQDFIHPADSIMGVDAKGLWRYLGQHTKDFFIKTQRNIGQRLKGKSVI